MMPQIFKLLVVFYFLIMTLPLAIGQFIEYSVIVNEKFYKSKDVERIECYNLEFSSLPLITNIQDKRSLNFSKFPYEFPLCWKINNNTVLNVYSGGGSYPSSRYSVGLLEFRLLGKKDSAQLRLEHLSFEDSLKSLSLSKEEIGKAYAYKNISSISTTKFDRIAPIVSRFDNFYFVKESSNKVIENLGYDMLVQKDTYIFFLRTGRKFTIWKATINYENQYSILTDWREEVTYTSDSTYQSLIKEPVLNAVIPSGKKHLYQSIEDKLFFHGHFKVIQQKDHLFLVNTNHGAIYYIGEKGVHKIGQIKIHRSSRRNGLNFYPKWILGERIFIEDKDENRLIILKFHVEQLRDDLPFPNITVIESEEELKKLLPFLDRKK